MLSCGTRDETQTVRGILCHGGNEWKPVVERGAAECANNDWRNPYLTHVIRICQNEKNKKKYAAVLSVWDVDCVQRFTLLSCLMQPGEEILR